MQFDFSYMTKEEAVKALETIAACAHGAWEHTRELLNTSNRLCQDDKWEAACHAHTVWQAWDSALKSANLQQFK